MIETADELEIGLFGIAVATEEEPRFPDMPPHSERAAETPDLAGAAAGVPRRYPVARRWRHPSQRRGRCRCPYRRWPPCRPRCRSLRPRTDARAGTREDEPAAASETALISAREARAADLVREEYALSWSAGGT